jgi:hypothetical protein
MDELQVAMVETTQSDSIVIVEAEDEDEESVEGVGKIEETFDSTMCNTPSVLDDASPPTTVPVMIETTDSESIVLVEEGDKGEEEEEKERTKATETVASNDGQNPEEESKAEEKEGVSLEGAGKLIRDLLHSANTQVDAALDAFSLDLKNEDEKECKSFVKKKCDNFVTAGGCLALLQLLNKYLDKSIAIIQACDQVTELNELAELTTLYKTLGVIISLTFLHDESIVGIAAIGGVEAVVKVMKTFPKCQMLQKRLCSVLLNLASNNIGKARAIESGGIEALIAAVNNHLSSAIVSQKACSALCNIVRGSKENTGLLITLGGGAAVAKVRTKWPNDDHLQTKVRRLANLIAAEMKAWADEV